MRKVVFLICFVLIIPGLNVQAHTPNVLMNIMKDGGAEPGNILETTGFVEGDGVKFKVVDITENVTMRVSIDLDGDGNFSNNSDFISPWLVEDCEYDENGSLIDDDCQKSVVFYFNESNGSGTYDYQIERMVNGSHTNYWIYSIFVGVDNHDEMGLPTIGDCFGAGCQEQVDGEADSKDNDSNKRLLTVLIIISAMGVIFLSLSMLNENKDEEE